MKDRNEFSSLTPEYIKLLFNNDTLDLMKLLCLLNALSFERNKQRTVEEILYYFTIINFELKSLIDQSSYVELDTLSSVNQYYRFQTRINGILINLSNLKFIAIKGKLSNKVGDLKIKLLKEGKIFFESNSTEYFKNLKNSYLEVIKMHPYTTENLKKIKEITS